MVDTYVSDTYALRVCGFKSHLEHQKNLSLLEIGDFFVFYSTCIQAVDKKCPKGVSKREISHQQKCENQKYRGIKGGKFDTNVQKVWEKIEIVYSKSVIY